MPHIRITVPHQLSVDEALSRLQNAAGELKAEYADKADDFNEHWEGSAGEFRIQAFGMSVAVQVMVNASEVTVTAGLPLLAMPFKNTIETQLKKTLERILEK